MNHRKEKQIQEEKKMELFFELEKAKMDLDTAMENFNNASMELVDYYSYRIKAAESKYDYLLKLSKDMNVSRF